MDLIEIPVGTFLKDADRAAIVEVMTKAPPRARVVEALRGLKLGEEISIADSFGAGPLTPGQQLLIACSKEMRFCIYGLPRAGYYEFAPHFAFPVQIPPGYVEPPAMRAFAAGKTAGDVCAYVHLAFIDEPQAPEDWALRLAAADGKGTGRRGLQAGATEYGVQLFLHEGKSSLAVQAKRGEFLSFIGSAPRLGKDGCYSLNLASTYPLARTRRDLDRLLTGAQDARHGER